MKTILVWHVDAVLKEGVHSIKTDFNNPDDFVKTAHRHGDFIANPIIYHLLTDRFCNSEPSRAAPPGRAPFGSETGAFYGGNFSGITSKLREGWFSRLGVNAILLSPPYEQIHGWVPGGAGSFRHCAYHGYYALDFTVVEPRYGTVDDLRELVDAAHSLGIAVLFDVVMNHPGYPDPLTMENLGIAVNRPGWETAGPSEAAASVDLSNPLMNRWWGGDWVRGDMQGCLPGGTDDLTMTVNGLPDFRTESKAYVALPTFLREKRDTLAVDLPHATVRDYLIDWLTGWVRELGIDGFRCDTARHVELPAWQALKSAASVALREWKAMHPLKAMNDAPFWMMGEVYDSGIARSAYYDNGFDSLLNFQFQADLHHPIDGVHELYTKALQVGRHVFVSYVSSHDTRLHEREDLLRAAVSLMLVPGGVLVFYGDETGRPVGAVTEGDPAQSTRSPMQWDAIDENVLLYWQRLGQFRARHRAVSCGTHRKISSAPHAFSRFDPVTGDLVIVALNVPDGATLPVGKTFPEGVPLIDAFSGRPLVVRNGSAELFEASVILIESAMSAESQIC